MLDLERLNRIRLTSRPVGQRIVGYGLGLGYRAPGRKAEIVIEGAERIPKYGGAFLAMNHTDRYNYWPFQYQMWKLGLPFTATWVKGKYYENRFIGAFMDSMNNIPLPSRGYVISTVFRKAIGRPPNDDEYRLLRDLVDGKRSPGEVLTASAGATNDVGRLIAPDQTLASAEQRLRKFDVLFETMLARVVELNRQSIEELRLNVLVFPEGTRSRTLTRGLNGLAQISQYLGASIVPIGCSGSDKLYPGNSPISKGGRVVYRVGEALAVDSRELLPHRVSDRDVLPFTKEAGRRYGERYTAITEVVMARISELLDPEYRAGADEQLDAERGVRRFL
jgi:1-acyl-sn-glycerol-3-phosphate acyltransferase